MTGIAILRHDLYDVDRVLVNAVSWTLLTAALIVVYALVTVGVGVVLGRESALVAAAATALAAIAFAPLRRRIQAGVDRRLYPLRRSAFDAIDSLHSNIGKGEAQPEELDQVLQHALRDPDLRIDYQAQHGTGSPARDADEIRAPAPHTELPVYLGQTQIGVLRAGATGIASLDLLRQIAQRAAPTVAMALLRQDLASAVREVEASRARLVQIGYEERRRLERDLHDGAQQRLVALGMDLRLAQRHLDDPVMTSNLDAWVAELATAVAELRQIAHGIRPSSLDDGLEVALSRLVSSVPVQVDLTIDDTVLPDGLATTVYYVVSEALTNAVKHSEATRIELSVLRGNGCVAVRIRDDGRGGARLDRDSTLADRVNAMGGVLRVLSPVGSGTTVEAELPCVS